MLTAGVQSAVPPQALVRKASALLHRSSFMPEPTIGICAGCMLLSYVRCQWNGFRHAFEFESFMIHHTHPRHCPLTELTLSTCMACQSLQKSVTALKTITWFGLSKSGSGAKEQPISLKDCPHGSDMETQQCMQRQSTTGRIANKRPDKAWSRSSVLP